MRCKDGIIQHQDLPATLSQDADKAATPGQIVVAAQKSSIASEVGSGVTKDNGKIRIVSREGIPYVEIYHNGELKLHDVVWIEQTLRRSNQPLKAGVELALLAPEEIIIDGTCSYSLLINGYRYLGKMMSGCNRIAFVIHSYPQGVIVDLFKSSFQLQLSVGNFDTVAAAVE